MSSPGDVWSKVPCPRCTSIKEGGAGIRDPAGCFQCGDKRSIPYRGTFVICGACGGGESGCSRCRRSGQVPSVPLLVMVPPVANGAHCAGCGGRGRRIVQTGSGSLEFEMAGCSACATTGSATKLPPLKPASYVTVEESLRTSGHTFAPPVSVPDALRWPKDPVEMSCPWCRCQPEETVPATASRAARSTFCGMCNGVGVLEVTAADSVRVHTGHREVTIKAKARLPTQTRILRLLDTREEKHPVTSVAVVASPTMKKAVVPRFRKVPKGTARTSVVTTDVGQPHPADIEAIGEDDAGTDEDAYEGES